MTIRFIPADKCVHAVVGALSGAVALVAAAVLSRNLPASLAAAAPGVACALTSAALGVGIELRQRKLNADLAARGESPAHDIEAADAVATAAGGIALAAAYALGAMVA